MAPPPKPKPMDSGHHPPLQPKPNIITHNATTHRRFRCCCTYPTGIVCAAICVSPPPVSNSSITSWSAGGERKDGKLGLGLAADDR